MYYNTRESLMDHIIYYFRKEFVDRETGIGGGGG